MVLTLMRLRALRKSCSHLLDADTRDSLAEVFPRILLFANALPKFYWLSFTKFHKIYVCSTPAPGFPVCQMPLFNTTRGRADTLVMLRFAIASDLFGKIGVHCAVTCCECAHGCCELLQKNLLIIFSESTCNCQSYPIPTIRGSFNVFY